jgi:hypothetical protein
MAENYNINNLELDDNSFYLLPDGDYHFIVDSHEVGFATSDKLPQNTQQITCYLEIPYINEDGDLDTVTIRNNLNVYKKALFAIRQFAECIGMVPEKGKAKINLERMDGLTGVCSITSRESAKGNEFNNAQTFYPPSKTPAVTANDEAWKRFQAKQEEGALLDVPFLNV